MIWLDIETRSRQDVTKCGVYRLREDPSLRIISMHYAFDDEPVQHWAGLFADGRGPEWRDIAPLDLFERIADGEEIGIWNAQFERHVWNAVAQGANKLPIMPQLKLKQLRCIATLARAHNLPSKLKTASLWLPEKHRKLANDNFPVLWRETDEPLGPEHAGIYELMLVYGDFDVVSMRELARIMTPFPVELQQDYEVSERINDRGIGIDRDWCRTATGLKGLVDDSVEETLAELTRYECVCCSGSGKEPGARPGTFRKCGPCKGKGHHVITSAKQPAALKTWVQEALEAHGVLTEPTQFDKTKKKVRKDGTGYFSEIRQSFDKNVRAKLREWMDERGVSIPAVDAVLEAIEEGSGAASTKYQSALDRTNDDGIMRGMYILDGAAQTGRYASVGMQTHNMVRDVLPDAGAAMEEIASAPQEAVKALCWERWEQPVNKVLGRLLRPTLVPSRAGRVLIWGDWSAVEARVCPWLSASPRAEPLLDLFRAGKDVYLAQASEIAGYKVTDRKDPNRQLGKVAVLSLGFGGAAGAYVAMARNYGVTGLPVEQVKGIVASWRAANLWAREWWDALEAAARMAFRYPVEEHQAGRVSFTYLPALLEGTLVMWLPDGRPLFYPAAEIRMGARFEDEAPREVITFVHAAFGRIPLWYGQLAENATQATAASLLRLALTHLDRITWFGEVVGHTHDEIIVECDEAHAPVTAELLRSIMATTPDWAPGLPLDAEVSAGFAYYEPAPELLRTNLRKTIKRA